MHWIQVSTCVSPNQAEAIEEGLMAAGAAAVTMQDAEDRPIFEPELGTTPLWQSTTVTGLFAAETDIDEALTIAHRVFNNFHHDVNIEFKREILENEDWTRKWIENFKPIQFGSRLWVCPSWCPVPDPQAVNLLLDPGLAFGTGTHPTTALCLTWLDQVPLSGKVVVDYGCGSGVLGIAALLLGAKQVIAIDNDPQALQASRDNALRNSISDSQLLTFLPQEAPHIEADVLVANILAQPLFELMDTMSALLKTEGKIAMSGILKPQAEKLLAHYATRYQMDTPTEKDGWVRLSGLKSAN